MIAEIAPDVILDGRLALYHRTERWLAVADLHYGFELTRRQAGGLPPLWGMGSTGERLRQLVSEYRPETVVFVGDLVEGQGTHSEAVDLVQTLGCETVCIIGNHDRGTIRKLLPWQEEWETPTFHFHHGHLEKPLPPGKIQITGHLHPTVNLNDGAGLSLKLPALVQAKEKVGPPRILPLVRRSRLEEIRSRKKQQSLGLLTQTRLANRSTENPIISRHPTN